MQDFIIPIIAALVTFILTILSIPVLLYYFQIWNNYWLG